jgi:hypothetical protein
MSEKKFTEESKISMEGGRMPMVYVFAAVDYITYVQVNRHIWSNRRIRIVKISSVAV